MKQILAMVVLALSSAAWATDQMPTTDYTFIGPGKSVVKLGAVGGSGDILDKLIVAIGTAATGTVDLQDGTVQTSVPLVPAGTAIGTYSLNIGMRSSVGAWRLTTGTGVSVWAIGRFK